MRPASPRRRERGWRTIAPATALYLSILPIMPCFVAGLLPSAIRHRWDGGTALGRSVGRMQNQNPSVNTALGRWYGCTPPSHPPPGSPPRLINDENPGHPNPLPIAPHSCLQQSQNPGANGSQRESTGVNGSYRELSQRNQIPARNAGQLDRQTVKFSRSPDDLTT